MIFLWLQAEYSRPPIFKSHLMLQAYPSSHFAGSLAPTYPYRTWVLSKPNTPWARPEPPQRSEWWWAGSLLAFLALFAASSFFREASPTARALLSSQSCKSLHVLKGHVASGSSFSLDTVQGTAQKQRKHLSSCVTLGPLKLEMQCFIPQVSNPVYQQLLQMPLTTWKHRNQS